MKNIVLVYMPFCSPASPPYSITNLYSFLKNNTDNSIKVFDFNLEFHLNEFGEYGDYFNNISKWDNYKKVSTEYMKLSKDIYSENNNLVVKGDPPEQIDEFIDKITKESPDFVAISVVYSSQAFYSYYLIKKLKELGIKCVVGGPAVNEKLTSIADKVVYNEQELLDYIQVSPNLEIMNDYELDYSIYNINKYFTPFPVIPLKNSSTCFYKKCSFCTHYGKVKYKEYDLEQIKNTIISSKQKYFFFIDDMISVPRLLKLSEVLNPLNIFWTCQLRPTKDHTKEVLTTLKESGLIQIMWGVESGNDRILSLINKGTNFTDIQTVLINSNKSGIKNIAYIIFGFPTETKLEFLDTINFLKKNKEYIDLVSTSVFGLQKDNPIFDNFIKFGIEKLHFKERTILGPLIDYDMKSGNDYLSQKEAMKLRDNYKKTLVKINNYPKNMNYFREHMICYITKF